MKKRSTPGVCTCGKCGLKNEKAHLTDEKIAEVEKIIGNHFAVFTSEDGVMDVTSFALRGSSSALLFIIVREIAKTLYADSGLSADKVHEGLTLAVSKPSKLGFLGRLFRS